jgi:hypothetical protein
VTFLAFARQDSALRATIPALRDVLRVGRPALASLDAALPSLRNFSRDALPGVRSSGPTIDASMPFIHQVRLLVRPQELRGLVADLRPTIPALARLNRATIPLLNEGRALSACQNNVLVPFSNTPIPDPDFPDNTGELWYKQSSRGVVALAGESRLMDADSPTLHVQINGGATTVLNTNDRGEGVFATAASNPLGVRPARPNSRPVFRPNIPCELQEPPDLNAPGGGPDKSVTQLCLPALPVPCPSPGLLPDLPPIPGPKRHVKASPRLPGYKFDQRGLTFDEKLFKAGQVQMEELKWYRARKAAGLPAVAPYGTTYENYLRQMKKLGFAVDKDGKVSPLPKTTKKQAKP